MLSAGACPQRQPAVGGAHLTNNNTIKGTLDQGSITVSLNGVALSPSTAANFTAGVDHNLTLTATGSGNTFNGLLFRLGGSVNTKAALRVPSGDSELQVAKLVCIAQQGVGGVTHARSNDWTKKTIILRLNEDASDLPLDVTVVVQNDADASIWYYSAYTLNAVGGNVTKAPSSSSPRSNTTSTSSPAMGTTSTPPTHPSKVFITSVVLLGILAVVSFMSMLPTLEWRLRSKSTTQEEEVV